MNCDYAEMDWYCCKEKGHKGTHESRPLSEGKGVTLFKIACPECCKQVYQEELNTFGGFCENCREIEG